MKRIEEWWFKYFSVSTLGNQDEWLRYAWAAFLTAIAITGFVLDIRGDHALGKVFILSYTFLLLLFGIVWIVIYLYHNYRIKHER